MAGLPDIHMAGTLTADPELRFTGSGAAVATFTVACNDRRLNRQTQEWEDVGTTYLRCQVWRQQAENLAESLTRGMRVMVTGELRQRSYETREGEKRTVLEVEASEVAASFLYATAKVQRVGRSSGSAGSSSSRRPAPDDDPWGNAPQPTGDDEPPF